MGNLGGQPMTSFNRNEAFQSPPTLKPSAALPSSENYVGAYGLQYVNGYQTPSYDTHSNSNGVPYWTPGPNDIPILPVNNHIETFGGPLYKSTAPIIFKHDRFDIDSPDSQHNPDSPDSPPVSIPTPTPTPIALPPRQRPRDLPNASSVWEIAQRQARKPIDVIKVSKDFTPLADIPEVIYRPKQAVWDPITRQVTFNPPTSNNNSGDTTFNGDINNSLNSYAFDPSIPDDGYDSRTGKLAPWAQEHRLNYWKQRQTLPWIPGWPDSPYDSTPIYSTQQINNIMTGIRDNTTQPYNKNDYEQSIGRKQEAQSGETESILFSAKNNTNSSARAKQPSTNLPETTAQNLFAKQKESFVPSSPNNYRNPDGSVSAQYNNPNMLMKNGTAPIINGRTTMQNPAPIDGPGPITTEFNAAAASMALLNDMNNCPSGANRGPMIETKMPDYNLQDPRNSTWGRDNRYYGITAEYARDDPTRYRYLRHPDYVQKPEPITMTADASVASFARRRNRDIQALDRVIQHQGHGLGYVIEELDTFEAWADPDPLGGSEYPM
jgi:hypothetical protein